MAGKGSAGIKNDAIAAFKEAGRAIFKALKESAFGEEPGRRPGQYALDLYADRAAKEVLKDLGLCILSEEDEELDGELEFPLVVLDPVDGSTNASRDLFPYALSVALVDEEGPLAGYVKELKTGEEWLAVRGEGLVVAPDPVRGYRARLAGFAGTPPALKGFSQLRAFGCCSVELCLVASGALDAFFDFSREGMAIWDYFAGGLCLSESGKELHELFGADLWPVSHGARRSIAAGVKREELNSILSGSAEVIERKRAAYLKRASRALNTELPEDIEGEGLHLLAVALVVGEGGVLVGRRVDEGLWTFPGGHIEKGELPFQAAAREAAEELGVEVGFFAGGPHLLGALRREGAKGHDHVELLYGFTGSGAVAADEEEFCEGHFVSFEEAPGLVGKDYVEALSRLKKLVNSGRRARLRAEL